jgi:hypothetical protein
MNLTDFKSAALSRSIDELRALAPAGLGLNQVLRMVVDLADSLEIAIIGRNLFGLSKIYLHTASAGPMETDQEFKTRLLSHIRLLSDFCPDEVISCECGSEKVGSQNHSHWCPKVSA